MSNHRFGLLEGLLLLVVVLWAAGARIAWLTTCTAGGEKQGPIRVQDSTPVLTGLPAETEMRGQSPPHELDALVQNLSDHQWFGMLVPFAAREEITAHSSPGYPWLLAWLAKSPVRIGTLEQTIRWVQVGLGTLAVVFYFLFALWAFRNPLVALLAGLLCAVHPFWILNTTQIDDGVVTTFLLAAAVYLGTRGLLTAGPFASLLFGLALAGLSLVRAPLLPFAIGAMLVFLAQVRRVPHGWRCALLGFLGFVIGLAPWSIRNFRTTGDAVPIVNSSFYHIWMGHNPQATGSVLSEREIVESLAAATGQEVQRLTDDLAKMDQRDRYLLLGRETWKEVRQHPGEVWRRRLWAGLYFVFGQRWFTDRSLCEVEGELSTLPSLLAESYEGVLAGALLLMLSFGFLGWRWSFAWRQESSLAALALILVPLPYLATHAEMLCGPRLPLDGVLLTFAAFALGCFVPGVRAHILAGPFRDR